MIKFVLSNNRRFFEINRFGYCRNGGFAEQCYVGSRLKKFTVVTGCLLKIWLFLKENSVPLVRVPFDSDHKDVCAMPSEENMAQITSLLNSLEDAEESSDDDNDVDIGE